MKDEEKHARLLGEPAKETAEKYIGEQQGLVPRWVVEEDDQ
jgi:hypothetical protein